MTGPNFPWSLAQLVWDLWNMSVNQWIFQSTLSAWQVVGLMFVIYRQMVNCEEWCWTVYIHVHTWPNMLRSVPFVTCYALTHWWLTFCKWQFQLYFLELDSSRQKVGRKHCLSHCVVLKNRQVHLWQWWSSSPTCFTRVAWVHGIHISGPYINGFSARLQYLQC